jgi:UDP-N-acetylglucosamine acyltransferase
MIHETAIIYPNVKIHPGAHIGPYAVIGGPPQVLKNMNSGHGVIIGENAYIGPFCQIDGGIKNRTIIGENAFLMGNVHVGHDCIIEPYVVISQGAILAGHVHICEGATIGIGATIHQFQIIGHYAMIGMGSVVTRRSINSLIMPGQTWAGAPAQYKGMNQKGLERAGIQDINRISDFYLDKFPFQP